MQYVAESSLALAHYVSGYVTKAEKSHLQDRLKNHKVLEDVAKHNPDSEDIFQSNLLDTYYPQRPNDLQDVCTTITVVQTVGQERGNTASLQSLDFPTTDSLILKRKSRDKAITIL